MASLSGLKILVTRPKVQAEALASELMQLGAVATVFPTLDIRPVLHPELELLNFENINKIIFISPNAVVNSVALNSEQWQTIPKHCQIISMGSGTTEALQQYHVRVDLQPQQNATSESLLALPDLLNVGEQQIVVIAGDGGRELIVEALQQRGAVVEKMVVYQRSKPKKMLPPWPEGFDVLISTSGESLRNLKEMLLDSGQPELLKLPLLIISQRMLHLANELGFEGSKLLAYGASNAAIIDALQQWSGGKSEQQSRN